MLALATHAMGATPEAPAVDDAASPAAAPPAQITPPRVVDATVAYPPGAEGAGHVVLELVVERDGSVSSVEVLSGDPPFAAAAAEAAAGFRFEPALRNGRPAPARIRFEVRYTPPPPPPETGAPPLELTPEAELTQVTEVRVLGEVAPGAATLSQAEVRVLPGAFGDPFRAISVLPGVGQLVTGLPLYFARGAPAGNLGFFVDGIRVPLLFHAFLGPSVIHPRMLERVELHSGAYPARFGRYAGGVVHADLSEPRGDFNLEWSVRALDAGVFVDAPFAGGRGNALLAGRYSYTALLLSALSSVTLDYWDYQALVGYDLSSRGRLSVFAFGAYDFAATEPDPREGERPGDTDNAVLFHRVDLRYDHRFGESTRLRLAATFGTDATRGGQGYVRDVSSAARIELRSQLASNVLLRAGLDGSIDRYELELDTDTENFLDVLELFPRRTDRVLGAHADLVVEAAPGVTVTPGLRVDHYHSAGRNALGISPRLAASFRVNEDVSIEHAIGLADQPPNFVPGVPGATVGGLPGGLQRSLQSSAGVRAELPWNVTSTATLFHNAFFNMSDPFGQNQDLELDAEEASIRSTGHALGLEILLQRRMTRRFGGSLSYTLSRSTRSYGRIDTLSGYDRPHVLNLGASYDLGRRWLVSARSIFYSGVPGSRTVGRRRIFDASRAPAFFRVDLRLEKRFQISESAWWAVVAEVMNASLSREVLRRPCQPDCQNDYVGPIVLPNLGVHGQF